MASSQKAALAAFQAQQKRAQAASASALAVAKAKVPKAPAAPKAAVPAASPYTPPVSPVGVLPIDLQVGVDSAAQGAQANLANTVAGLDQAAQRAQRDAGYNVNLATQSFTVDPSNPYSRASAIQRAYDQSKAGATNSMAARGQLYSGSLQNAQNENTRVFGENDNANRQQLLDFLVRTEGAKTQAQTDASNAAAAARAEAIRAAAERAPVDSGPRTPAGNPLPVPGSGPLQNRDFAAEWKASLAAQVAAQVAAEKKAASKKKGKP